MKWACATYSSISIRDPEKLWSWQSFTQLLQRSTLSWDGSALPSPAPTSPLNRSPFINSTREDPSIKRNKPQRKTNPLQLSDPQPIVWARPQWWHRQVNSWLEQFLKERKSYLPQGWQHDHRGSGSHCRCGTWRYRVREGCSWHTKAADLQKDCFNTSLICASCYFSVGVPILGICTENTEQFPNWFEANLGNIGV